MNYFKPISISLSPNVQKDDVKVALQLLIRPWLWKKGKANEVLENEFKKYVGVKHTFSFNSGRSSLYAILKALDLEKGSEVALQAFTCNAVPNPVLWAALEPLYIDCNDDFNMEIKDLEAKITPKTKAVVIQHTFGLPANLDEILAFCRARNLIVIEDCAHALGADYKGKKVGTFGDVSFFSFSRDKVISSVYGGMAATNDDALARKIKKLQGDFGMPSLFWIRQQIFHPILLHYFILPVYGFLDLGKIMLVVSQILHILGKAVSWQEKRGLRPDYFPKALPNALAVMALNQLKKTEVFNLHRRLTAEFYYKELEGTKFGLPKRFEDRRHIFLRFPLTHKDAHEIIYQAWSKRNILIGDWYTTAIAPFDTNMKEMRYVAGSCPNAERLAKRTFNLPTHINISKNEAERVVAVLKNYA